MTDIPRPGRYSDSISWEVAKLLAVDLQWQFYEDSESEGYEGSEFQALVDTLREELDWDGYSLARNLDDGYNMAMTAEIVNTLDVACMYQVKVHDELVRAWVQATGAKPKYNKDDVVKVRPRSGGAPLVGKVHRVEPHLLNYVVYIPEHAEEGRPGKYIGSIYIEEDILGLG